ncbi:MAG: AAA family ATPase [Romboutsia sp.]
MRPIKLELSGLNSYIEKSVIDFEKLTERGLFGIFGKTGSGKSTILDAITMAMYGKISRNTKEYINTNSEKARISYEFELGSKNSKRRYLVDRTIERNKTENEITYARLVEIHNNGEKIVLANKVEDVNKKITQIVGLTADDFTRTAVLPQGKFNDFLKLTGSERRDMLERIFNLEKYGKILIEKVKKRKNNQLQNLSEINIKLNQYDGISKEVYDCIVRELEELKNLEKQKNEQLNLLQKSYEYNKDTYENQINLEKNEKRKKELNVKFKEIKEKSIQLENAVNAEKINPHISGVQNLEKNINEDSSNIAILEKKLEILNKELLITKNKYEESYTRKNERMPKLTEEKTNLQRALQIEENLIILEKELKYIKEKDCNLSIEKDSLIKNKKDLEFRKDIIFKTIKELEDKINKITIGVSLKQKIFLAYEYEKEYNNLLKEKKYKTEKVEQISNTLNKMNLKIKYVQRDKDIINSKINNSKEDLESLVKKCPGQNEDIVNKTEYVTSLKSTLEIIKENEVKKDEIQSDLNNILEVRHSIERELNVLNEKSVSLKNNIKDEEKEIDKLRYENLASELRKELREGMSCPVCGSRHHENLEINSLDKKIEFLKENLSKLKENKNTINNKIEELNGKNSEYISAEKIKIKELKELKSKLGEIISSEISSKLEDEQRMLEVLKINIKRWQDNKKNIDENINKLKEEQSRIEKDEVKLQESINNDKKLLKNIKDELEIIEQSYKKAKDNYLGLKAIIKITDISSKVEEINKNEKIIEELNQEYVKVSKDRDEIEYNMNSHQVKIHELELELMSVKEIYGEKKKLKEEKYNELAYITKGEKAEVLLAKLDETITRIINQEECTKKKLEEQRLEYQRNSFEKSNIDGRLKISIEQYKIQTKILDELLLKNKFDNIYSVKKALLAQSYAKRLHEEIIEYEEEEKILNLKINELNKILNGRKIKKEDFDEIKNNIYMIKVELGNIQKEIGAKQNILSKLREDLEKIIVLNNEQKIIQHKVDLLEDLDKVIQGNRFVEYVATNQLKYVALEASKRLEDITKGRYALEIDSSLNFVMRDNFNGGQRRSVETLSGGETFLTSLALALSLSSQIQLKGNSPLEIFFLDEGFGSLDTELLEIVIQSLERLHNEKLSIGIISHVEELKNRVPIKLIVTSNEYNTGSEVKIEYS